jgi:hypothetical protein
MQSSGHYPSHKRPCFKEEGQYFDASLQEYILSGSTSQLVDDLKLCKLHVAGAAEMEAQFKTDIPDHGLVLISADRQ